MEKFKAHKKQLLALKKELKCWESMFERKHGRKPAKIDIDESPPEIRDTYNQYHKLKAGGSVSKERKTVTEENEEVAESGVFGVFLNKSKSAASSQSSEGSKGGERAATWKLRKWTKGQGYKTVTVEEGEKKGDEDARLSDSSQTHLVADEEGTSIPDQLQASLEIDIDLEGLSQGVRIKGSDGTGKDDNSYFKTSSEEAPVISGPRWGFGSSPRKLHHGHNVSGRWLDRCKPDLRELQVAEESQLQQMRDLDCLKEEGFEAGEQSGVMEGGTKIRSERNSGSSGDDSDFEQNADSDELLGDNRGETGAYERIFGGGFPGDSPESENHYEISDNVARPEAETSNVAEINTTSAGVDCRVQTELNTVESCRTHLENKGTPISVSFESDSCLALLDQPYSSQPKISGNQAQEKSQMNEVARTYSGKKTSVFPNLQTGAGALKDDVASSTKSKVDLAHTRGKTLTSADVKSNAQQKKFSLSTPLGAGTSQKFGSWKLQRPPVNSPTPATKSNVSDTSSGAKLANHTKPQVPTKQEKKGRESVPRGDKGECSSAVSESSIGDEEDTNSQLQKKDPAPRTSRTGVVSENFVRLNMKLKRYGKKPGRITGSAYKRMMWKKRQMGGSGGEGGGGGGSGRGRGRGTGRNVCFKCGKPGHWARNCTERGGSTNLGKFAGEEVKFSDSVAHADEDLDAESLEQLAKESPFPSVEEAAMMARGIKPGMESGQKAATARGSPGHDGSEECDNSNSQESGGISSELRSHEAESSFVAPPPCHLLPAPPLPTTEPLFETEEDGSIVATHPSVHTTLQKFGYESFRSGQEEAVVRILSGVSTLVVLSTGSGKSLCYQLPAYLYSKRSACITLVISPLVALMEDQVRNFPAGLRGVCLHTNQTQAQRERVLADVVEGRVDVLLLSPEALVGGAFWSGRGQYSLSRLPPVAFACIDEAHCVSEWSHNFRPSYLRLYKVLRERLGVHCILGLTATATRSTALSVANHLGITEENIIRGSALPSNLHISVSCDPDRDQALVQLLQSPRMRDCESIIIYCTRQQQTERISQLLRTCLQSLSTFAGDNPTNDCSDAEEDETVVKGKQKGKGTTRKRKWSRNTGKAAKKRKLEWSADCYHAGMMASQRKRVQQDFMTGRLRIVVATVAFGMGLNKADVRAIIHYNMPKSFESYVQEIGRAGRDGQTAYCHVFIDKEGSDRSELRRHAYSSSVDPYTIKQLVQKVFLKCQCKKTKQQSQPQQSQTSSSQSDSISVDTQDLVDLSEAELLENFSNFESASPDISKSPTTATNEPPPMSAGIRWCAGHEVAVSIDSTVQALDVKEECLATLLCYLELRGWLEVMSPLKDTCTLKCYGGPRQLRALARKVPAVAAAVARTKEQGNDLDHASSISFSVVGVSNSMGWESRVVRSELHGLQYNDRQTGTQTGPGATSSVLVEFTSPSFHIRSPGDLSPDERDYICSFLYSRVKKQEETVVEKLHLLHAVLNSVACEDYYECVQEDSSHSQARLKSLIHQYFEDGLDCESLSDLGIKIQKSSSEVDPELLNRIRQDVHSLVSIHSDQCFSGRAVARMFHGIASPCFAAEVWGRQRRFWRRYLNVDFNLLCQIATKKLLELR